MHIKKITSSANTPVPAERQISEKQLYDELNYHRAKKLTEKMFDEGLIAPDEFDKIQAEIRRIFVPILAEIL